MLTWSQVASATVTIQESGYGQYIDAVDVHIVELVLGVILTATYLTRHPNGDPIAYWIVVLLTPRTNCNKRRCRRNVSPCTEDVTYTILTLYGQSDNWFGTVTIQASPDWAIIDAVMYLLRNWLYGVSLTGKRTWQHTLNEIPGMPTDYAYSDPNDELTINEDAG